MSVYVTDGAFLQPLLRDEKILTSYVDPSKACCSHSPSRMDLSERRQRLDGEKQAGMEFLQKPSIAAMWLHFKPSAVVIRASSSCCHPCRRLELTTRKSCPKAIATKAFQSAVRSPSLPKWLLQCGDQLLTQRSSHAACCCSSHAAAAAVPTKHRLHFHLAAVPLAAELR